VAIAVDEAEATVAAAVAGLIAMSQVDSEVDSCCGCSCWGGPCNGNGCCCCCWVVAVVVVTAEVAAPPASVAAAEAAVVLQIL
jgi:hypothetical protein